MADEVKVIITGEATSIQTAMGQASAAVREGVTSMKESLASVTESFAGFGEMFAGIAGLLAGGALFKEIISSTKELTENSLQLGIQLGISASAASVYQTAIELVGGKTEDYSAAMRGLNRQLKLHEESLNELGLKTRDANGNLLAGNVILQNAVDVVNSYKEGIDRSMAAQEIFGRGVTDTNAIFRENKAVTDEARKSTQELGLVVGEQSKQAFEENRTATAEVMKTLQGMGKVIGDALLPVLTQLAEWFRSIGPAAIAVLKGALAAIMTPIWVLIDGFNTLFDIVKGVFDTIATVISGLMQVTADVVTGRFGKVKDDLKNIANGVQADWKRAWDQIGADATKAYDNIHNLWSTQTPIPDPTGGKDYHKPSGDQHGPDNRMAIYKNTLEEMSQAEGDFDKKNIQGNIDYWQAILANTVGNSKEDVKLRTEIQKEILALEKKQHDEQIKEAQEYEKTVQALELGEIAAKEEVAKQDLALGNITNAQFLQLEKQFEDQKFQIKQQAIANELALNQFDLLGQQKLKDQELVLEQQHAAAIQKIDNQAALAQNKVWQDLFKSMQSGFAQTIAGFLKGTSSLGGAVKGLFQDIASSVINSLAQMAAKNLEVMLESMLLNKTAAMQQIRANAASGAAAAYQAVAGIPYIGPFLAPAAAAVAYGAIMVFGSNVASAAGGYDIPSGMNPMTQLHQNEMVLPAKYANVIRGMAQSGGGMTINISAIDARSLQKALTGTGARGPLASAIRGLGSRFVR